MIHARVDADAVNRNALVSLCNRYPATEGRIPRTNVHELRRQAVRTMSARDVPQRCRQSPGPAQRFVQVKCCADDRAAGGFLVELDAVVRLASARRRRAVASSPA